jgi:hypothetical protein
MFFKSSALAVIGLFFLAFSARGAPGTVEGGVKDAAGRPIEGAGVWIQGKDFSNHVRTDSNGHYISDILVGGSYRVTVVVDGAIRASIVNAEMQLGKSTKLDFELTTKSASTHKHKRMVWVAPEIGTHIGGGSWVEADDSKQLVDRGSANNAKKLSRNTLASDASIHPGVNCSCLGNNGSGAGLAVGRPVSSLSAPQEAH